MSDQTHWTTICPQCGYESEDSAMCQSCGRLMDESVPVLPFSLAQAVSSFAGSLSFETTREVWDNEDKADFHENIQKSPVYSFFSGNIFHKNTG